jgi:hypothetical protein
VAAIQHREYRTWRWVLWLLLPGRALHELTHAVVGQRWAAAVAIDWRRPAVSFVWDDAPYYGVLATHLAPFVLGYTVGTVVIAAMLFGGLFEVSLLGAGWLVANWLYYSFPTRGDLSVLPMWD